MATMETHATSPVTLGQLLAIRPEHEPPAPGDIVDYVYEKAYEGGRLPIRVRLTTDVAGIATFTVTAEAQEVRCSLEAARKALARSTGNDPDTPEGIGKARNALGTQEFASNAVYLAKRRLMCLAYMRTGVLPFLAADHPACPAPIEGQDFTFTARVRLRPRGEVSDFSPVRLELPAKPEVDEAQVEAFMGQMMGGTIDMASVPDEARAAMDRLRAQAREACEGQHDVAWRQAFAQKVCEEFAHTRLVDEPGVRYVTQLAELMANQFAEQLEASGRSWDEFTRDPDFDMDQFKERMMQAASESLRQGLALDCVVEHAHLTLTQDDVLASLGGVAPGTQAVAAQAMIDNGQLPQVVEVTLRAKAADWLAERAVQVEAE